MFLSLVVLLFDWHSLQRLLIGPNQNRFGLPMQTLERNEDAEDFRVVSRDFERFIYACQCLPMINVGC